MRLATDHATLTVPATSANLGPGFDTLGLALELRDRVIVRAVAGETRVTVRGEGAGTVAAGEDHLVVRAIRIGLEFAGAPQVGLDLVCHNAIPHARGLGSSAAAVVVGLVAARALVAEPETLSDDVVLQLATDLEGHPDNAAPALHGGATLAWVDDGRARWVPLEVSPRLEVVALVPEATASTRTARAALPRTVSHTDAVFNVQRAALMVEALRHPELLMAATEDRLHQPYRREVMGQSLEVMDALRARGVPAVLSGAGPTVLAFGRPDRALGDALIRHGWRVEELPLAAEGGRSL
ncbi:MAG: homoserine kinase [Actinomycetes bacterium]|nr:homoserine kinase [Actinomycetes bacterium]MDX5381269.1 homoserine kinase [Actinomycetes bacterium]MDX5400613.1 homoserine kinase [Actinomycetes bacterium]MDX5451044.1 homoserine kinase [Actinomycetes bacterium]